MSMPATGLDYSCKQQQINYGTKEGRLPVHNQNWKMQCFTWSSPRLEQLE